MNQIMEDRACPGVLSKEKGNILDATKFIKK